MGPAPDTTLTPPFLWGGKVPLSPCFRSLSLLLPLRPPLRRRGSPLFIPSIESTGRVEYVLRLRCALRYFVSLRGTRAKSVCASFNVFDAFFFPSSPLSFRLFSRFFASDDEKTLFLFLFFLNRSTTFYNFRDSSS